MIKSNTIFVAFEGLKDPRRARNQVYPMLDIIAVSILAILCGADNFYMIQLWAESSLPWLQENEICLQGAPSHDTLSRFFRYVDSRIFEECFINWTRKVHVETL